MIRTRNIRRESATDRIFAVGIDDSEASEFEVYFETITPADLRDPVNMKVDAEYIVMARALGYDSVEEFCEEFFSDFDVDIQELEDTIESEFLEGEYCARTYTEYQE